MSRARLYIHPLCPSSYSVLKKLWSEVGGPGALEIVSVDRRPEAVLTHGVVSTPWLEVKGVAMAADPMEPELAVEAAQGGDLARFAPAAWMRLSRCLAGGSWQAPTHR